MLGKCCGTEPHPQPRRVPFVFVFKIKIVLMVSCPFLLVQVNKTSESSP